MAGGRLRLLRWRMTSILEIFRRERRRESGKGKQYSLMVHDRIPPILPMDVLNRLYNAEKLSAKVIARRHGISQSMRLQPVQETRTLNEAMLPRRNQLTRYERLRKRVLDMFGGECVHCGCTHSRVLELHHRNGGETGKPKPSEAARSGTISPWAGGARRIWRSAASMSGRRRG